jgi:hypothetical protein
MRASSRPPAIPPSTPPAAASHRDPSSWRPLFLPPTMNVRVRRGPTRTSEIPPPIRNAGPSAPIASSRPMGWTVVVLLGVIAGVAIVALFLARPG